MSTDVKIETKLYNFEMDAPISETNLNLETQLKNRIINFLLNCDDEMKHETNVKATMTNYFMHKKNPDFKTLSDIILKILHKVIEADKFDSNESYFYTMDCWGAVYSKGHEAVVHHHFPSLWSWCYYLKCPKGSSPLVFPDSNIIFEPKENELVIFPAYLNHYVPVYEKDEKRIMIAGNIGLDAVRYEKINYKRLRGSD